MWQKILLGLITFVVLIIGVGFLLPTTYQVSQQEQIIAAPRMIFTFIGDFNRWHEWTSWSKQNPELSVQISSPSYGRGATQELNHPKFGPVKMTTTEWTTESVMSYEMLSEKWPAIRGSLQMLPAPQGAMVKWTAEGRVSSHPIKRYMIFFVRWWANQDVKQNLAGLKNLAENSVAAEIKAPWHKPPTPPLKTPKSDPKK